jgi:hypothetical protein
MPRVVEFRSLNVKPGSRAEFHPVYVVLELNESVIAALRR